MNILFINKSRMNRIKAILLLEKEGDLVITTSNSGKGVSFLKFWKPDKIIYNLSTAQKLASKRKQPTKPRT
jgi:hypothetical protein